MANSKKLRSALHSDISNICTEVAGLNNVQFDQNSTQLITELVWKKMLQYGGDLEAFSKHAKRATINHDDVKLLVRRNEDLKKAFEEKCKMFVSNKSDTTIKAGAKRKKSTAKGSTTASNVFELDD